MINANTNKRAEGDPWPGRIFTGLAALMTLASGMAKLAGAPVMLNGLIHAGFPRTAIIPIAILELTCTVLFLIPRTAGLGVLLLTGFFGGATVTHIVSHENFAAPLIGGLLVWAAAFFRLPEFVKLLPLGSGQPRAESYGCAGGRQPLPSRS